MTLLYLISIIYFFGRNLIHIIYIASKLNDMHKSNILYIYIYSHPYAYFFFGREMSTTKLTNVYMGVWVHVDKHKYSAQLQLKVLFSSQSKRKVADHQKKKRKKVKHLKEIGYYSLLPAALLPSPSIWCFIICIFFSFFGNKFYYVIGFCPVLLVSLMYTRIPGVFQFFII